MRPDRHVHRRRVATRVYRVPHVPQPGEESLRVRLWLVVTPS